MYTGVGGRRKEDDVLLGKSLCRSEKDASFSNSRQNEITKVVLSGPSSLIHFCLLLFLFIVNDFGCREAPRATPGACVYSKSVPPSQEGGR